MSGGPNAKRLKRVLLLNDSILTFGDGEDVIIRHLTNESASFSGITENYEFNYHVGSFALGISGEVLLHKRIQKYWKNYVPLSTRRHSIHKGEMKLTKTILKAGFQQNVLLSTGSMKIYLNSLDIEELDKLYRYLMPSYLDQYGKMLLPRIDMMLQGFIHDEKLNRLEIDTASNDRSLSTKLRKVFNSKDASVKNGATGNFLPSAMNMYGQESSSDFDHKKLYMLRYRKKILGIEDDAQNEILINNAKNELIDTIIVAIFRASQIHCAAPILLHMNAGIVKKDVVFRCIIEPHDIESLLTEFGKWESKEELSEAVKEILSKGHPYSYNRKLMQKILYNWGFL